MDLIKTISVVGMLFILFGGGPNLPRPPTGLIGIEDRELDSSVSTPMKAY